MSTNTFDIQHGMEVFASDGEKIGTVDKVHDNSAAIGTESGSQATSIADESSPRDSDSGNMGVANNLTVGIFGGSNDRESGVDRTRDPNDLQEAYGTAGTATSTSDDTGYFTVKEGGFLGLGAKELYIPFSAVETVAADGIVTLSYTKDDVGERFNQQPNEDDDSNTADTPIV